MKKKHGREQKPVKMEMAFAFDPESEGISFKDQIVCCAAHMFDGKFGHLPNVCKVSPEIFQNLGPVSVIKGDGFVVKVCKFRPEPLDPEGRYWLVREERPSKKREG